MNPMQAGQGPTQQGFQMGGRGGRLWANSVPYYWGGGGSSNFSTSHNPAIPMAANDLPLFLFAKTHTPSLSAPAMVAVWSCFSSRQLGRWREGSKERASLP